MSLTHTTVSRRAGRLTAIALMLSLVLPVQGIAATSVNIVKIAGDQSIPALTSNGVVFQSASVADGPTDLMLVPWTGATPASNVAVGTGYQLSPVGAASLVAYVDRSEPDPSGSGEMSTAIKVIDLVSRKSVTIVTRVSPDYAELPSISDFHLVWSEARSGSKDVMYTDLDADDNGTADFLQTPQPSTLPPTVLIGGVGDQYGVSAGERGFVWVDRVSGVSVLRFRPWSQGAQAVLLSSDAGYKYPSPVTAGPLVVWKQLGPDGTSDIAMHNLDAGTMQLITAAFGSQDDQPTTDGATVAWVASASGGSRQVWLRFADGAMGMVAPYGADQSSPRLGFGRLVWIDSRFDGGDVAIAGNLTLTAPRTATTLSLSAPAQSDYGSARLTGTLEEAGGAPLSSKSVRIQQYSSGAWKTIATVKTGTSGTFSFTAKPTRKSAYRAQFVSTASHQGKASATRVVVPRVALTVPEFGTSTLAYGTTYTATGYLKPRHTGGSTQVKIKAYRLEAGVFVLKETYTATTSDHAGYSKYVASITLPSKGTWRLRAYHATDALNAATYSGARDVIVE